MRPSGPYGHYKPKTRVTISKTGYFCLSMGAFEVMGQPEAVIYAFDASAKKIGLIPASRDHKWSYPVDTRANRKGSFAHRATAREFLNTYGVSWRTTRQFPAAWRNGLLEFNIGD